MNVKNVKCLLDSAANFIKKTFLFVLLFNNLHGCVSLSRLRKFSLYRSSEKLPNKKFENLKKKKILNLRLKCETCTLLPWLSHFL